MTPPMRERSELQHAAPSDDVRAGVVAMAPFVLAYAPFALVIGSVAATVDPPLAGWAGSWLIYGGSAHLAALQALHGAGAPAAVLTGLLVNTRLLVYSTGLARQWRAQPAWFRAVGAALLVEPTWALADEHARRTTSASSQRRFHLAAGITLGIGWSAAIAAGAVAGDRLPSVGLEVAVPLCMLSLLGPRLRTRRHRWAAAGGAATALATLHWPAGTGVLAAIAAGSIAAALAERGMR